MGLSRKVLYSTALPIYALGLVGNVVSVAVWSTQVGSVGGARFLLSLSISDTMAIVSGIVSCALFLLGRQCTAGIFVFVQDFFYTASCSVTIAIVIQRYLSIAYPFSVARLCSGPRQRVTVVLLVVLTGVRSAYYGKLTADRYTWCTGGDMDFQVIFESFMTQVYAWVAMDCLAPCILVVFNVLLLRNLRNMKTLTSTEANRNRDRAKIKVSLMALWVSVTTIVTYVMSNTVNIYYTHSVYHRLPIDKSVLDSLVLVRDLCIALTVSVNVVFYSYFCESFRDVIKRCWRNVTTSPSS